jgi:hypothetical protein
VGRSRALARQASPHRSESQKERENGKKFAIVNSPPNNPSNRFIAFITLPNR